MLTPLSLPYREASRAYRAAHPLCRGCEAMERVTATALTDHIVPHKGDATLFWNLANWQPACHWHHNVVKQILERRFARGEVSAEDLRLESPMAIALSRKLMARLEARASA